MDNEKLTETASWLSSLFTGWGLKACWAKVLAGAIIGAIAAACGLSLSGCQELTPEQVQRIESAHELYHILTGKECILKEDTDK